MSSAPSHRRLRSLPSRRRARTRFRPTRSSVRRPQVPVRGRRGNSSCLVRHPTNGLFRATAQVSRTTVMARRADDLPACPSQSACRLPPAIRPGSPPGVTALTLRRRAATNDHHGRDGEAACRHSPRSNSGRSTGAPARAAATMATRSSRSCGSVPARGRQFEA